MTPAHKSAAERRTDLSMAFQRRDEATEPAASRQRRMNRISAAHPSLPRRRYIRPLTLPAL